MFDSLFDWASGLYDDATEAVSSLFSSSDVPDLTSTATDAAETFTDNDAGHELPGKYVTPDSLLSSEMDSSGALPQIANVAQNVIKDQGQEGFMAWLNSLDPKSKNELARAAMSALGGGASEAMKALAQKNRQDFEREQDDRKYAEERGVEDRAREERAKYRSVARRDVSMTPRGIIGAQMGGG